MSASTPDWTIEIEVGRRPGQEAVAASLLALSDGVASVVGNLGRVGEPAPLVLAAGSYGTATDGIVRPLPAPVWNATDLSVADSRRWQLDLRTGALTYESEVGNLRLTRFQSIARPGIGVTRVERHVSGSSDRARATTPELASPPALPLAAEFDFATRPATADGVARAATLSDRSAVTVAVAERCAGGRLDRFVAVCGGATAAWDEATRAAADARRVGFDALWQEQAAAWTERWNDADIEIDGDPDAQLAVRYALSHILSCAAPCDGGSPVGARGLTGLAYAGHVFWDTEMFVLPVLAATSPTIARSVIEYRLRRVDAAREAAVARGAAGIRFPWESADDGADVTPRSAVGTDGSTISIVTGTQAEHINSDIAWALLHYVDWTGDADVLDDGGGDIVVATADYLASRARVDATGAAHIDGVVGPDEYHESVDDNAYTNGMARWHLRRAAALERADPARSRRFIELADALVTGFDADVKRHEQSARFWELDDVVISEIAEPPVAADVWLGRDTVEQSQIVKQPDVLMLHHVLGDELPPGSLAADLDYYLPRTAHGSSLSPAICAALLARSGRADDALVWFDVAARLDLDDLTGTTARGLHLATMGGLWQAVVRGFAGVRPTADGVRVDPVLPARWRRLVVTVVFRGERIRISIDADRVRVDAKNPVPVVVYGRPSTTPVSMSRRPAAPTSGRSPVPGGER